MRIVVGLILFCGFLQPTIAFEFSWEIDETPEGQESATVVQPVQVDIFGEVVSVPAHSAALRLMQKYSVHLGPEWSSGDAYRLLLTFESIPQKTDPKLPDSLWHITSRHVLNDIEMEYRGDERIVTVAEEAFVYAAPLLAEIDGVRGRYFSKRLHRAVVRFVTHNGTYKFAIDRILERRYAVSVRVPDFTELTKHTTQETAASFDEFKNEEIITILTMLEEYPEGMLKTPGLKYLVRRKDGIPHPISPEAAAIAWTGPGYIEFMEKAFKKTTLPFVQRLVLHEKAHFLWDHLFDEQLKQDWIEVGGWYENPDDKDGWSTTKQVEFVSAYAHGVNPNEDMAESIAFYIVDPDKLRSRSPTKYEFIQNRVMHGTRYISKIREDLTFQVYNLWPDYVYPGRIIGIDIQVEGAPEEDKLVTVILQLHGESDFDTATRGTTVLDSEKGIRKGIGFWPIDEHGEWVEASHVLKGELRLSKYAPNGYWTPDQINVGDANKNERYSSQVDFGWKLYIDNPLADCEPPQYVPNSLRLSLSESQTHRGERFQVVTARWKVIEDIGLISCGISLNDENSQTYSLYGGGYYWDEKGAKMAAERGEIEATVIVADYRQSGTYRVGAINMRDLAGNSSGVSFIEGRGEEAQTIDVETRFPDDTPPELDVNSITIKAEPTNPEAPNGETRVDIMFRARDDIAGYNSSRIHLRDPQGVRHGFSYYGPNHNQGPEPNLYFLGDPTVYQTYHKIIILPIGSPPGTWGLSDMTVTDKAENRLHVDFTEIVRFVIIDMDESERNPADINIDGFVNIQDLVIVALYFGETGDNPADVNGDGIVDIRDLVFVAAAIGDTDAATPSIVGEDFLVGGDSPVGGVSNPDTATSLNITTVQSWLNEAKALNLPEPQFQRGILFLENLLKSLTPKQTALLPNYPNPFNPETWIPYQLASPTDVSISIYTTVGKLVQQIDLGHQPVGIHQVHWEGNNKLGEKVASGVYFYTLTAGEYTATRKMSIMK